MTVRIVRQRAAGGLVRAVAALALASILAAPALAATKQQRTAYRAAVATHFADWVTKLRVEAMQKGVSPATFDVAMKGVTLDWSLNDLAPPDLGPGAPARPGVETKTRQKQQPEFDRPARYFPRNGLDYVTKLGRKNLGQWKDTLAAIEEKFGVERHVVLAIWGRETAFGKAKLPYYAVRALATQAFMGRRREKFHDELLLALRILEEKHITRKGMKSSWAGAMGHTQFLPSDFHNYAVDFTGDGRRDIWGTVPDALASTANFLKQKGWETGKTWGYEVRLPKGFDCTLEGIANQRTIADWAKLGITRTRDREFRDDRLVERTHLMLPAGTLGPAFLVLDNFEVFRSYNKADLYALYVGHVADRIAFGGTFERGWSRVESFTREEMKRLQQAAANAGYDVGKIDGLIGSRTRAAIGKWQRDLGHKVTCYPPRSLLKKAPPLRN
ncbi:MAG: lytic murein transglycosylase [Hyphomicrobiales bacterium]|nr:lytic murein transglycosylase [Hyphomicrobiales bacterium]